ncbi:hypothetical protein [Methylocaldum szegediense]|jgi:hypothetical protein|uniref:Uncharacterized protein n=1 Tax=Methylocaldum szegediense TaxID=73780 RepID=A0ABM9I4A8_9GAMM|nr:hypothetical protein [Methylocaldum szegediense]CAI8883300.1 conserved membrane protein of unknown function [Methylocaldum szegediense]
MEKETIKRSLTVLVLLVIALQVDTVLSLLLEGIHILVEVVELAAEHLLEALFGLTTRASQVVTAWLGFAVFLAALPFIVRKIKALLSRLKVAAVEQWRTRSAVAREWARTVHARRWVVASVILIATYTIFF